MGQAKNRKAEIDALKAKSADITMGFTYVYEPKGITADEVYPTVSIRASRDMVKDAKDACLKHGVSDKDLYSVPKQYFKAMLAYCGEGDDKLPAFLKTKEAQTLGLLMIAYAFTYKSVKAAGELAYQQGHVITVKEWSPDNPNGAQHGGNRMAYALDYADWEDQVKQIEASPELLKAAFEPLFSLDPMIRMAGMINNPCKRGEPSITVVMV
jgi:hypothetical protein